MAPTTRPPNIAPQPHPPALTADGLKYVQLLARRAAEAVAEGFINEDFDALDFVYLVADLWRGQGDAPDALACCDRHALDPLHGGPCAAWVGFPSDSEDGCEVVE